MTPNDDKFDFEQQMPPPKTPDKPKIEEKEKEKEKEKEAPKKEVIIDEEDKQKKGTAFDLILEDEEEQEEQEEEEIDPNKDKDKDKDKNDKEASNAVLRKQRDEARELAKKYGNLDPEVANAMNEYITSRFGDNIPSIDEIRGEFQLLAEKDNEIQTLRGRLEEQGKSIRDLDIRMSPDFKNEFIEPYNTAVTNLQVEVSQIDDDGKVLAPQSTASFHKWLLDNKKEIDPMKMKAALATHAKNFKAETGMDYVAPSVSTMMSAIGSVNTKSQKMGEAYDTWEKTKNESATKAQKEREKIQKENSEGAKRIRKAEATKAMSSYNYDELIDLGLIKDKNEYTKIFSDEFRKTESIFEDPSSAPSYADLTIRGFKASHYDSLLSSYKKLKEFKDAYDAEQKGESRGGGGEIEIEDDKEDDWDGGRLKSRR